MAQLTLDPIPVYQPVLQQDPQQKQPQRSAFLADVWYRWIAQLVARLGISLARAGDQLSKSSQSAALAATTIFTPSQPGTYLVLWQLVITIADGVSSSATVTISWTDNTHALSKTFPAITGDSVTTSDSGMALCTPDSGLPIQIAVAYTSNTPAKMHYKVAATVVQVA